MALTAEEKVQVAEAVGVGLIAREVADRLLSGRVTKAEMSMFRSILRVGGGGYWAAALLGRLALP